MSSSPETPREAGGSPATYDHSVGGDSGSTDAVAEKGGDGKINGGSSSSLSPKIRKAAPRAESKFWENSSRTWTARRSAGSPLGELSPSNSKFRAGNFSRSVSYERMASYPTDGGEWPTRPAPRRLQNRLNSLQDRIILTADKWTQTTDGIDNHECGSSDVQISMKMPLSSLNGDRKNLNHIERRLTSNFVENGSTVCNGEASLCEGGLFWFRSKRSAFSDACHRHNITAMQSNADGFNQEVEKLIQYADVSEVGHLKSAEMVTPDGHRAPIAELLSMGCSSDRLLSRSPTDSYSENRFVRISEDFQENPSSRAPSDKSYMSAVCFGDLPSTEKTSGRYQHPKYVIVSPSPVVFKSLRKRQAPEGSEMDAQLSVDISRYISYNSSSPVKMKPTAWFNIPSEHSAFCPLLKKYVGKKSLLSLSLSGEIQ